MYITKETYLGENLSTYDGIPNQCTYFEKHLCARSTTLDVLFSLNNMQQKYVYNNKCSPKQILVFFITMRRAIDRATRIYVHCVQYSCINIDLVDV
jgi:hypothetical protein